MLFEQWVFEWQGDPFRRATFDEGPSYMVQWNRSILLANIHKLDPKAFRWRSKTKMSQINAKPTWHHFGGQHNWFGPQKKRKKKSSKAESSWFGEPRCKLRSKARSNSRIQFASNESKLVRILGIWTLDPSPKVGPKYM
jgi:hypothetical protein